MPDYHFYQKGKQIVALERSEENQALKLINQGYESNLKRLVLLRKKAH